MAKKEKKDNKLKLITSEVEPSPPQAEKDHSELVIDPRINMTDEEIAAIMAEEEEELNGFISRFSPPPIDSSGVSEEDEEEEEFTLDLAKNVAYEKVAEGIIYQQDGETVVTPIGDTPIPPLSGVTNEDLDKLIEQKIKEVTESKERKYRDFVSDVLVRKALASLLSKTRQAADDYEAALENALPHIAEIMLPAQREIEKKRTELRRTIVGNIVHYENIPDWADEYIRIYIDNAITDLAVLSERD